VETAIDSTRPCFSDAGYAAQAQLGDHQFTNNKVIAAKVFNNKTPSRHYTPAPLQDHGTHVAGTVGCNLDTPATVQGAVIPYLISGVAPRSLLGNYNVFPDDVLNARSEDILDALEAAYADGFDVANMSLGGGSHCILVLLTIVLGNVPPYASRVHSRLTRGEQRRRRPGCNDKRRHAETADGARLHGGTRGRTGAQAG